jgi:hypothetical protein
MVSVLASSNSTLRRPFPQVRQHLTQDFLGARILKNPKPRLTPWTRIFKFSDDVTGFYCLRQLRNLCPRLRRYLKKLAGFRKNIILFFLLIPAFSAHSSLFFTKKEIQIIKKNILSQHKLNKMDKNLEYLYLSSIIYVDEAHWTLWLNHQIIHSCDPQHIHGFQIEKVTPLMAEFSWIPPQSADPVKFTLHSHQMFLGKENRTIQIFKN